MPALGQAVKPTTLDQRFVLCPYCHQHRAQVWGGGRRGCSCQCPECGPVAVEADDMAALALDEEWLRRKLRLALEDRFAFYGGGISFIGMPGHLLRRPAIQGRR